MGGLKYFFLGGSLLIDSSDRQRVQYFWKALDFKFQVGYHWGLSQGQEFDRHLGEQQQSKQGQYVDPRAQLRDCFLGSNKEVFIFMLMEATSNT